MQCQLEDERVLKMQRSWVILLVMMRSLNLQIQTRLILIKRSVKWNEILGGLEIASPNLIDKVKFITLKMGSKYSDFGMIPPGVLLLSKGKIETSRAPKRLR